MTYKEQRTNGQGVGSPRMTKHGKLPSSGFPDVFPALRYFFPRNFQSDLASWRKINSTPRLSLDALLTLRFPSLLLAAAATF